ncbi:hypothetical protein Dimus_022394 [Dionaea muscipula]
MTRIHLKKKDVVKSSVKGISIEFDHELPVAILDVPQELEFVNTSRRPKSATREMKPSQRFIHFLGNENVIPRFWEERHLKLLGLDIYGSLNGKEDHESPLLRSAHFGFQAFGVPLVIKKGEEPKKYDFFEDTFLTMCKLTREDGIWWIGSGENRRRDDDEAAPEEEVEGDDEGNKDDFDWEAVIDEATVEGESESDDQFYDAQKDQEPTGVDPSGLTGRDAEFLKFQAEFERKRANKFHDELEKAKAENAKLLALLHQAKFKSNP